MDSVDSRIPGSLSQLNLEEDQRENLLDYMKQVYPSSYTDFIWTLLGDDKFLMFFDVLEGLRIKIPSRPAMARIVANIQVYTYLKNRGCSDEAFDKASHIFKKRESALRKIYNDVEKAINGEGETLEDD